MRSLIKISIVVPVYNVEKYLRDFLDNITNQSLKEIEIICLNDGSSDSCLDILEEYAKKDSRIMVVSHKNMGAGATRNKGIELANGEYIGFADPDDWLESDMYETMYNKAKENDAEIVQCDYLEHNEYSGKIKKRCLSKTLKKRYGYVLKSDSLYCWKDYKKACIEGLDLHVWNRIYKTDFIKHNGIKFGLYKNGEDHEFLISSNLCANKIFYTNEYFYNYRVRTNSLVNKSSKNNFCAFDVAKDIAEIIEKLGLTKELENEYKKYTALAFSWMYTGVPEEYKEEYQNKCKDFLDEESYKYFLKLISPNKNFLERVFSIKNKHENGIKCKMVTVCGISYKIKPHKAKCKT